MDEARGPGRPEYDPSEKDRRMVETMAGFGVPQVEIARSLRIDAKTLRKHFPDQIDQGALKANMLVAQNLHRIALGNGREAVTACIFWLKARAGWSDRGMGDEPPPIGKKEQQEQDARTAEEGTDWEDLLRRPSRGHASQH